MYSMRIAEAANLSQIPFLVVFTIQRRENMLTTPKESSNAYTFVLVFSWKPESWI